MTVTGPTVLYSSWMMRFQLRYQKCLDAHARSAVQTKHQMAETGREPKVHLDCLLKLLTRLLTQYELQSNQVVNLQYKLWDLH